MTVPAAERANILRLQDDYRTQKSGGAVIPLKSNNIKYLVGASEDLPRYPTEPFAPIIIRFLDDLAKELRDDKDARLYPDILSFAFWCRKGNINKLKEDFSSKFLRIGRGLVFHIAPSNVPVNFAFSLVFGLLAGNGNVVRISTKSFRQVEIICRCINYLLEKKDYEELKSFIKIISYERDEQITDYFSSICDARMIWGGDETIREITKSPVSERVVEVHFADRFSFGIINPQTVLDMNQEQMKRLAEQFYNDTYLMDQNACSAPHLIVWLGDRELISKAKETFWSAVYQAAAKYDLAEIKVSDKFTLLCEYAAKGLEIAKVNRYKNRLYIAELEKIPDKLDELRGKYGLFFEITLSSIDELAPYITQKVQTCLICGVERELLLQFILKNHLKGIDRIVPFGASLDIGLIWDGYDLINYLTRTIG